MCGRAAARRRHAERMRPTKRASSSPNKSGGRSSRRAPLEGERQPDLRVGEQEQRPGILRRQASRRHGGPDPALELTALGEVRCCAVEGDPIDVGELVGEAVGDAEGVREEFGHRPDREGLAELHGERPQRLGPFGLDAEGPRGGGRPRLGQRMGVLVGEQPSVASASSQ